MKYVLRTIHAPQGALFCARLKVRRKNSRSSRPSSPASEYIFPAHDGGKMDLSRFRSRYYYPAIERIGVTKRPPYACRHTYATMLKNIDAPTVGHASYTMTAHYTHSDIKSLTAITDELNVEKD